MRVAIVGGGATGALAALHLARFKRDGAEIVVIEPAEEIGRGMAYATDDPEHLLNVRVANMSAFADQSEHLFKWLQREGWGSGVPCPTPYCFIPRGVYGAYLAGLGRDLINSGEITHVRDRCVDLIENRNSVRIALESGDTINAEIVVLATGNETKSVFGLPATQPWTKDALQEIPREAPVLIIGTGLTMVDMALSLDRQGHRGKITAVSPRGLLPSGHQPVKLIGFTGNEVPFGAEISELMAWLRRFCLTNEAHDWRSAIDALRPYIQDLWRSMSLLQKQRFLRHARSFWDVHRHRMAPEVEKQVVGLRASGRLEIVAGRVVHAEQTPKGIAIGLARRGQKTIERRRFSRLINCTGLGEDPARSGNPLIRSLLARGTARVHPIGISLDVHESFALIDVSSRCSKRVLAIGPLARAAFWECTAIPDIRLQCKRLTQMIDTALELHGLAEGV
jgi:uncharacterized NAD(P)/FAD-binding protein YdhS